MKSDYLTSKPAFYALFVFSVPIIIGNLFQQLYTMVDSAVVGRFVGEQALAAVGARRIRLRLFLFAWRLAAVLVLQ